DCLFMGSEGDLRSDSNPSSSSHTPNPNIDSLVSPISAVTTTAVPSTSTTTAAAVAAAPAARRAGHPASSRVAAAATLDGSAAEPSSKRARLSCPYHDHDSAASARGSDSCSFCASAAATLGNLSGDHPAGATAICHATIGRFATLSMGMGPGDGAADSAGGGRVERSYQPFASPTSPLPLHPSGAGGEAQRRGVVRAAPIDTLLPLRIFRPPPHPLFPPFPLLSGPGAAQRRGEAYFPTFSHRTEPHSSILWRATPPVSHNGTRLATASKDHTAVVWQLTDPLPFYPYPPLTHPFCCRYPSLPQIVDSFSHRRLHTLAGHSLPLSYVAWSPDDSLLLTASNNHIHTPPSLPPSLPHRCQIVDSFSHRRLHTLSGHSLPLSYVAWSPDDSLLLTAGNDPFVCLWDAATGRLLRSFSKHHDVSRCLAACLPACLPASLPAFLHPTTLLTPPHLSTPISPPSFHTPFPSPCFLAPSLFNPLPGHFRLCVVSLQAAVFVSICGDRSHSVCGTWRVAH
ncbi:unnamed protein product, partial [Closterium sp. NIES-54]